ncbi:hypothetical protein HRG_010668 [Hirsutella rhossiliensis]|uniref:Uncharacterized protein n=1 Tax=Hirsutella rhossiliensis TaxID=111463 RepID=A0A9P8MN66_9HYPO|nr:uncharacterized protein HRG_10668 [Hirsutella rhossiliensis]KAH0958367.1 hypothetical protein HRG_10668 [Hirsutella rhossiliensis]
MEAPSSQRTDAGATSRATAGLEAMSIHQRARRHPRSRIVVEPLFWTNLQLELLRCTFSGPHPVPPATMKLNYPGDARRQAKFHRYFDGGDGHPEAAVRVLMGGSEVPLQWFPNLYFCLGGYRSILLPCSYFCLRDECEGDNVGPVPPVAAHIDHRHIVRMREMKLFQPCNGIGYNRPGAKLAKIKLRKLSSTPPLHEPYLVAVLIALAQQQWRTLGPAATKRVSGPKLLYTSGDGDFMHLYSTNISCTLIHMFDDPDTTPPVPQSLSIQISAIPLKPFETLHTHVGARLHCSEKAKTEGMSIYMYGQAATLVGFFDDNMGGEGTQTRQ